jgi:hypothetical protein
MQGDVEPRAPSRRVELAAGGARVPGVPGLIIGLPGGRLSRVALRASISGPDLFPALWKEVSAANEGLPTAAELH